MPHILTMDLVCHDRPNEHATVVLGVYESEDALRYRSHFYTVADTADWLEDAMSAWPTNEPWWVWEPVSLHHVKCDLNDRVRDEPRCIHSWPRNKEVE